MNQIIIFIYAEAARITKMVREHSLIKLRDTPIVWFKPIVGMSFEKCAKKFRILL